MQGQGIRHDTQLPKCTRDHIASYLRSSSLTYAYYFRCCVSEEERLYVAGATTSCASRQLFAKPRQTA